MAREGEEAVIVEIGSVLPRGICGMTRGMVRPLLVCMERPPHGLPDPHLHPNMCLQRPQGAMDTSQGSVNLDGQTLA